MTAAIDVEIELTRGNLDLRARLSVSAPATVVIVGPNGAGKTTLVRALAGLQPIDAGRIELDGAIVDAPLDHVFVPPESRRIGLVAQQPLLFPHLDALDNVAFGLRARGSSRGDARGRAMGALELVGAAALAHSSVEALSGGQARRVALARALAGEPDILLLDEPLTGIDAEGRSIMSRAVANAEPASCRIVVTHDPIEALMLADELVALEGGRVTQHGAIDDVARRPATPFVASLLGINALRGSASGSRVVLAGGAQLVSADLARGPVLVTVEPRSVALHTARPEGSPRNVWPTRVADIDQTTAGDRERLRVLLDDPIPIAVEITPAAAADLGLGVGTDVWASVKATEVDVHPDPTR